MDRAPEMSPFTGPTIDLIKKSHNTPVWYPQSTIQKRDMYIFVLNGALCVMEQVHCEICEIDLFRKFTTLFKSLQLTSIPSLYSSE